MPPKKQNKQNKKPNDKLRQQQEATRKANQDKADHSFLDAEIQARKKADAEKQQKHDTLMAISLHVKENYLPEYVAMPKVELHAHLSGSLSLGTIEDICISDQERTREIFSKYRLTAPTDLMSVFNVFTVIEEILEKKEALEKATFAMIREYAEEGCVYLEIRTGPKNTPYMTKEIYLRTVISTIIEARQMYPNIKVFLVVSFNRALPYHEAVQQLNLIGRLQLESNVIVGVELGGNPKTNAKHLVPIFQLARRFYGLGITIHLAEDQNQLGDVLDYLMILPDRIGHGTFLHTNPKFVELMTYYKIPLEICFASNVYTKTVPQFAKSHFDFWRKLGVPCSICTDDKGVIPGAQPSEEYYRATLAFNLTMKDLIQINIDALKASFAYKYNVIDLSRTWRQIENNKIEVN